MLDSPVNRCILLFNMNLLREKTGWLYSLTRTDEKATWKKRRILTRTQDHSRILDHEMLVLLMKQHLTIKRLKAGLALNLLTRRLQDGFVPCRVDEKAPWKKWRNLDSQTVKTALESLNIRCWHC